LEFSFIGHLAGEENPLVNGGYASHGTAIRPLDNGEAELVYPALKDPFVVDGQVVHDGLGANENVAMGLDGDSRRAA
jgi:hypothetical protein